MLNKRPTTAMWRVLMAAAAGTVLAASCDPGQIQAVTAGLSAAASQIDDQQRDDDINFGEWLWSEIKD